MQKAYFSDLTLLPLCWPWDEGLGLDNDKNISLSFAFFGAFQAVTTWGFGREPGLPDGLFSDQKSEFWYILKSLEM
jgi:hypothetical protein